MMEIKEIGKVKKEMNIKRILIRNKERCRIAIKDNQIKVAINSISENVLMKIDRLM